MLASTETADVRRTRTARALAVAQRPDADYNLDVAAAPAAARMARVRQERELVNRGEQNASLRAPLPPALRSPHLGGGEAAATF